MLLLSLASLHTASVKDDSILENCIAQIAQGDRSALEVLYNETKTSVYAYALSLLKNASDAEDVMQECYITVNSSAEGYTPHGKPMAWIMTIVKNLCFMRMRQQKKTVSVEVFEPVLSDEQGLSPEQRCILSECMSSLTQQEHQIVVLYVVAGFKHREIAVFMGLPLPTILSKYHRAIKKLRERLTEGGY